ncbi:hypothetical protein J6590_079904 [Homalodisca vitripennis]|nr:hypothetical protein J6590_079904 [Homalodisca vitripennis]
MRMKNGAINVGGEKEWGWRGPSCQLQIAWNEQSARSRSHIHLVARSLCKMDIDDDTNLKEEVLKEISCDKNNTPNGEARTKRIYEKNDILMEYMKRQTTTSDQKDYIDKHFT